jgi:hypothetical protein
VGTDRALVVAMLHSAPACFVFVEHDAVELLPHLGEIIESTHAVEVAMGEWSALTRRALRSFAESETLASAIIVVGCSDAADEPSRLVARALLARELVSKMALGHSTSLTFYVAAHRSSALERELLAVAETLIGEFRRVAIQIRFVASPSLPPGRLSPPRRNPHSPRIPEKLHRGEGPPSTVPCRVGLRSMPWCAGC